MYEISEIGLSIEICVVLEGRIERNVTVILFTADGSATGNLIDSLKTLESSVKSSAYIVQTILASG